MKRLIYAILAMSLMACSGLQGKLEKTGAPPIPPPKLGTAAELSTGTETGARSWAPKTLSDAYSGSGIEAGAFDFTTWDTNTNGATKDAIRDQFVVYDTDGDGDIDNVDGAVGGGDITGVGPAGLSAGDALTDGYATSGATLFVFEGSTVDAFQYTINVPAADPLASATWTFPANTGSVIVGAGAGYSDNILLKVDGASSHLTQATGITVDDSNNITGVGTISSGAITATGTSTFADAISPDSADSATIGSATAEWSDLYLADGGVIYGQNDQSNSITSSATGWTFALDVVIGGSDLSLGAAGVKLTGDGDGAVILRGMGDGFDEDININLDDTENTAVLSSSTGVTLLSLTSIGITTGAANNFSAGTTTLGTVAGTITDGTASWNAATQALSGFATVAATTSVTSPLYDVSGAAAITVGSADVTAITLQTDDTGDGTDLVLPAQSVNGSEMLNNTVTATQLAAALTMADGDLIDLSGITHTVSTDEGFVLPNWANVVPTSDKKFLAADGSNLKLYNGGWVTIGASAAPTDATYLTLSLDATLSAERVLTAGYALDFTDAGANGNLTIALDTTEVSADGSDTWSDGTQASIAWEYAVTGTNITFTAGNGIEGFSHPLYIGTDPADAGTIRLENAATILFEASPAGTDVNALTVTSGEVVQIGASGASGVTITPAITATGGIASIGAASDLSGGSVTLGTVVGTVTMATATDVTYKDGTVDPADLADADFGVFTVASGVASLDNGSVAAAKLADADFGSFTVSSGTATIDTGAITAAMMSDADHGDVAWSSGVATVEHFSAASESTVADDIGVRFGGAATDWYAEFDDSVDDQMLWHTTATAAIATTDPMFEILVDFGTANGTGMTADQQVFGVAKGTQASNVALLTLDEDGDLAIAGSFTSTGAGDSYITLANNTSYAGSGYQIFFEGGNLIAVEAGTEKTVLNAIDGATLTGTSWDFSGVTNFVLPTAAADASGEISMSTGNQLKWHDGTKVVTVDTTVTTDNYVLKYDNASATFNLEADETGGTPAINNVTDATGDATIAFDINEEMSWQFTGAYTTGTQFLVQQQTGNPTGGVLFEARGADADSTVAKFGDGTNAWTVSTAGLLSNAGTATINLAAANDLTVGGGQIDYDDMAGSGAISTSGTAATGVLTVTGVINTSVGLDAVGAVDMDYGSADVTDHTFTTDGGTVILDGSVVASAGVDLGTSQALIGTTAMTIGNNGQTIAINSSDWDIDATGIMTGMGNITSNGTIEGATLTEGGQAVYNASETPGGELGGTWASPTIDDTGIALTSITIGALLGVDSIDATGAVDMDYGSADITDHTFTTDGGTVVLDGSIVASAGIESSGLYDVTGATGLDLGSADVTDITLLGQSEDLVFTPSADLWTLSSSTGATVAVTPAIALNGGTTLPANDILSSEIATIVDSAFWDSGGMVSDGTQCADPAKATINSGPAQYTIICADNDASTIYGHLVMPDSWDGGTVTFELEYVQTAADTGVLNSDITAECRGPAETIDGTWGTEVAIDDAAVTGSNAVDHTTSAAVTPNGTCAAGDTLYWRWQMDATGTTTAVATLHILGVKMEYTSNVGD